MRIRTVCNGAPAPALLAVVVTLLAAGPAGADGHPGSGQVVISDPWSRELPPVSRNGAAYFRVANKGGQAVRIVGASTPVAKRAELHTHSMEGGVMKMRKVEGGLTVPAGGSVELAPGGLHLMLMDLEEPLSAGKVFPLTLELGDGGTVAMEVHVLDMDAAAKKQREMGRGGGTTGHGSGHGTMDHGSGQGTMAPGSGHGRMKHGSGG